jgi:hypothetical protein
MNVLKVVYKKGEIVKEISTIKKKSSSLHKNNRKDVLKAPQKSASPHPSQASACKPVKGINSFERLCLECFLTPGHPKNCFLVFSCPHTKRLLQP